MRGVKARLQKNRLYAAFINPFHWPYPLSVQQQLGFPQQRYSASSLGLCSSHVAFLLLTILYHIPQGITMHPFPKFRLKKLYISEKHMFLRKALLTFWSII